MFCITYCKILPVQFFEKNKNICDNELMAVAEKISKKRGVVIYHNVIGPFLSGLKALTSARAVG